MDIYLNPITNDIDLTNNQITLTSKKEDLIRQKIYITLSTFRGEWFANINFGIPYLENDSNNLQLLEKNMKDLLDIEIKTTLSSIEGVLRILKYSSILDEQRKLFINFTILTESGEITDSFSI